MLSQARAQVASCQSQTTVAVDPVKQCRDAERRAKIEREAQVQALNDAMRACDELVRGDSLLGERCDGSELILRDAFEDGSSVVCRKCGGLVKRLRWELHNSKWCPSLPQSSSSNDDDDDNDDAECSMDQSA